MASIILSDSVAKRGTSWCPPPILPSNLPQPRHVNPTHATLDNHTGSRPIILWNQSRGRLVCSWGLHRTLVGTITMNRTVTMLATAAIL